MPLPQRSSAEEYGILCQRFTYQQAEDKLTQHPGAYFKKTTTGETTGAKGMLDNTKGRDLVSTFYGDWPLKRVVYTQIKDFFTRLTEQLRSTQEDKPLRILEMGAWMGEAHRTITPTTVDINRLHLYRIGTIFCWRSPEDVETTVPLD
jgi:hypothetical protein